MRIVRAIRAMRAIKINEQNLFLFLHHHLARLGDVCLPGFFFALCFVAPFMAEGALAAEPEKALSPPTTLKPDGEKITEATVQKVQAFYDKTKTFRADFVQEFTATLHNKKSESKGTVFFLKPGKMSFRYETPAGNRLVSDGTTMKIFEAENKQLFEQTVDKSQYPAALSFLTGTGKLADSFTFEQFDGKQMNFPFGLVLVGTPKVTSPSYKKVLFYVDQQTFQVRRVMILDGQGNRNRFDFLNPHVNEPVAMSEFVFVAPPGTNIIRP